MSSININMEEVEQRLNKRKNTEEYVLFRTQIKRNRHISLFEIEYGQYFISNEELWTNNLTELKTFIDLNERRPSRSKETEKVLGIWLNNQLDNRKAKKNSMLNEDIINMWDSFIKDYQQYFISNEELWTNKLTELKTFIDLNKRRPIYNKKTENVLYMWLSTQLSIRKTEKQIMLNENVKNSWDTFIKDYGQYIMSNEELWTNKLTKLKTFIDLNKRRPNKRKETEKVLCIWLDNQLNNRKTKKQIMLNEYIRSLWDSFIKNYKQYFISNEELWINKLTELKAFIGFNKQRPSQVSKKETEKGLSLWLANQLTNRKAKKEIMLNEDIKGLWNSFIKDYQQYIMSNEELWTNNLDELKTFIDLNKRRPNRGKETEKVLGSWLANQLTNRKKEKKIMSNEDVKKLWDSFIKDYQQYFN